MNLSVVKFVFTITTGLVMMAASVIATVYQIKASKATIAAEKFTIDRLAALTREE